MKQKTVFLPKPEDTEALGARLALLLRNGGCLALTGDLGSGKSVLARGLAGALGIGHISSPTFTILQYYESDPPLYHIDAYRLSDADELFAVGFEDCLRERCIIVIEWADIVPEALPADRIDIRLTGSGSEVRKAELTAVGNTEPILEAL